MNFTPAVFTILTLCILGFLAELGNGSAMLQWLALWTVDLSNGGLVGETLFHPWQLVTYAFLHGNLLHLALNMYALWLFGGHLERRWGTHYFATYFLACVIGAGLVHLAVAEIALSQGGANYPVIGASGGVFGLLLAFGMRYPDVRLLLLFPPIPIKAKWFVLAYGLIELFAGVTGTENGVAHFAHLGGMLTGYLLLRGGGLRFF